MRPEVGDAETVLLKGDGEALVMEWTRFNASRVLVLANGSFLLNAALLNKARRPLAKHVVSWAVDDDGPLRVAFVEGRFVAEEVFERAASTAFDFFLDAHHHR